MRIETCVQLGFEAFVAVGFLKWSNERQALGLLVTEEDCKAYFKLFEGERRREFVAIVSKSGNGSVLNALDTWLKKFNGKGLAQWRLENPANEHSDRGMKS